MITGGSGMKIINTILVAEKIRKLDFNSEAEFNDAIANCSYPSVDCSDENKVEKFLGFLKEDTRIIRSNKTLDTIQAVEVKIRNLKIFGKLGT
jgi:hypothetical protein